MSKPKTYLAASNPEAQALHAGTQTVIVIPFDEQPTHFHRNIISKPQPWSKEDWERLVPQVGEREVVCPYAPGDVIQVQDNNGNDLGSVTVKGVQCRQVQSITEEQAKAAGIELADIGGGKGRDYNGTVFYRRYDDSPFAETSPRISFLTLWDARYGRQFPRSRNPWCFFITVEVER